MCIRSNSTESPQLNQHIIHSTLFLNKLTTVLAALLALHIIGRFQENSADCRPKLLECSFLESSIFSIVCFVSILLVQCIIFLYTN